MIKKIKRDWIVMMFANLWKDMANILIIKLFNLLLKKWILIKEIVKEINLLPTILSSITRKKKKIKSCLKYWLDNLLWLLLPDGPSINKNKIYRTMMVNLSKPKNSLLTLLPVKVKKTLCFSIILLITWQLHQ